MLRALKFLAGIVLIVTGVALWSVTAALIVAGVCVCSWAWMDELAALQREKKGPR